MILKAFGEIARSTAPAAISSREYFFGRFPVAIRLVVAGVMFDARRDLVNRCLIYAWLRKYFILALAFFSLSFRFLICEERLLWVSLVWGPTVIVCGLKRVALVPTDSLSIKFMNNE